MSHPFPDVTLCLAEERYSESPRAKGKKGMFHVGRTPEFHWSETRIRRCGDGAYGHSLVKGGGSIFSQQGIRRVLTLPGIGAFANRMMEQSDPFISWPSEVVIKSRQIGWVETQKVQKTQSPHQEDRLHDPLCSQRWLEVRTRCRRQRGRPQRFKILLRAMSSMRSISGNPPPPQKVCARQRSPDPLSQCLSVWNVDSSRLRRSGKSDGARIA